MIFKVDVLLPHAWTNDQLYSYTSNCPITIGTFVEVDVRNKKAIGLVLECIQVEQHECDNLKNIDHVRLETLQPTTLLWLRLVAAYNMIPLNQLLKMVLSSEKNRKPGYLLLESHSANSSSDPAYDNLRGYQPQNSNINTESNCYPIEMLNMHWNELKSMIKIGRCKSISFPTSHKQMDHKFFSVDQLEAIKALSDTRQYKVYLLHGSTGSGKTDVYFEVVDKLLKEKKQVLILVPEISLTIQLRERFFKRFGFYPYRWYSSCKQSVWDWAIDGEQGVVLGVRSALWLPFTNLGLIIVDEEHSTTYKQESGILYNAKDVAILRAYKENIPIILVSATPSMETLYNASSGTYELVKLSRTITHNLKIKLIDIKQDSINDKNIKTSDQTNNKLPPWLSCELYAQMCNTLKNKEQVLLFLNRKGFATHIYCGKCKNRLLCNACTAGLVFFSDNYTQCSYCGQKKPLPTSCYSCKECEWQFYGVGIEKIHKQISKLFPENNIALLSSDNINDMEEIMQSMSNGNIDILIGTQILSQGCHFPNLTLVGIIQADVGMNSGDFRSAERIYQLISQVKGRCGRAEKPGSVVIQTFDVNNIILKAIADNNTELLINNELSLRKQHYFPPFSRIIRLIISGSSELVLEEFVNRLSLPRINGVNIIGPTPTELHRYKNKYRWHYLFFFDKKSFPQPQLHQWIKQIRVFKGIKLTIDVDPQTFF
ncbi:MAG: primosomal protein N' [Alphaproteobacteria bacterium]|nr:MAG: primosomal protein N' [Alphaproteobacteria bacterium]